MTRLSRPAIGLIALAALTTLVAIDGARSGLPDPFRFAPVLALGSGAAPTGAHCTAN